MQHPIIDVPIESLPFVDEHFIEIAATPEQVWDALIKVVEGFGDGRSAPSHVPRARLCPDRGRGQPPEIGSTVPGFVVTRSVRPAVLALMGQHRFSALRPDLLDHREAERRSCCSAPRPGPSSRAGEDASIAGS